MTSSEHVSHVTIHVDDKVFPLETSILSGGQIKALVGKDLQYQLFMEGPGNHPDRAVGDSDSVKLESGLRFYTVPPAVFGA